MADFVVGLLIGGIGGLLIGTFCGYFYIYLTEHYAKSRAKYDEMQREFKEMDARVKKSISQSRMRDI